MGYLRNISIAKLLKWNLMSQVVEFFRRPRTMLKILYFSGDHQFFQNPPGINFLMTGIAPFSDIGRGGIIWNRGGTFKKIINPGGSRGLSHRGSWTGYSHGVSTLISSISLQINISNSYCQKCKHHLHLNQINLYGSLIHLSPSLYSNVHKKQASKCLFKIPL